MPSIPQTELTQTNRQSNSDSPLDLNKKSKSSDDVIEYITDHLGSKNVKTKPRNHKERNFKTISIFGGLDNFFFIIPTVLDYEIILEKINSCINVLNEKLPWHFECLFILPDKKISIIQIKMSENKRKFNLTTYHNLELSKDIKKMLDKARKNKNLNNLECKKINSLNFEIIGELADNYLRDCFSPSNRTDTLGVLLSTLIFKLKSSSLEPKILRISQEESKAVSTDPLPPKNQVQNEDYEELFKSACDKTERSSKKLQEIKNNGIQFTKLKTLAIFDPLENLEDLNRILAHFLNRETETKIEIEKVLLPLLIKKDIAVIEVTPSKKNSPLIAYISNKSLKNDLKKVFNKFSFSFKNFPSVTHQKPKISLQYKAYLILKKKIESHLELTLSHPTNKPTDSEPSAILNEISSNLNEIISNLNLNDDQTSKKLAEGIPRCNGSKILLKDFISSMQTNQAVTYTNPPKKSSGLVRKASLLFKNEKPNINSTSDSLTTEVSASLSH